MNIDKEKQKFLAALSANKYDGQLRLVFSNWLDEHGYDDEARVQREWTQEWQQAEDWLTSWGEEYDLSLDDVVQSGYGARENGWVVFGSSSASYDVEKVREEFFKHWQNYTKTTLDENTIKNTEFSCSC